jgi:lipopolysaccharide export system permease protein
MVEDGRDYMVYVNYSLLNFPKIVSKILPFALFFSFSYVLTKYELNNELMIYWNFGVHKIELINFFIKFSILLTLLQLSLTILIVPETQNISRNLVRNSNVDFFESFVKPKKFNDNINGLTIYAEEKNENGELKNIYLKKKENNNEFQITIAKKGFFKTISNQKILVLSDGQTMNSINNNVTNFSFSKSDFTLSEMNTDVVMQNKMQETKTINHISCYRKYLNKNLTINTKQKKYIGHNCSSDTLDNLAQELYKRIIIPLYIPILILISLLLVFTSKESRSYARYKTIVFLAGILLIIISETILRFIKSDFYFNIKIISLPIVIFLFLYIFIKLILRQNKDDKI